MKMMTTINVITHGCASPEALGATFQATRRDWACPCGAPTPLGSTVCQLVCRSAKAQVRGLEPPVGDGAERARNE